MNQETKEKLHPLYIIKDILNSMSSEIKKHNMINAHAVRNVLVMELKSYFSSVEIDGHNIIICKKPFSNVTQYITSYIKVLGKVQPEKIINFIEMTRDAIKFEDEFTVGDTRSPLQKFCRIFVAAKTSEPSKQLLWRYHIDHIFLNEKNMWESRYTGISKKEILEYSKTEEDKNEKR